MCKKRLAHGFPFLGALGFLEGVTPWAGTQGIAHGHMAAWNRVRMRCLPAPPGRRPGLQILLPCGPGREGPLDSRPGVSPCSAPSPL